MKGFNRIGAGLLLMCFLWVLTGCSDQASLDETPPVPETPFPVQLKTDLLTYTFQNNQGSVDLEITLSTPQKAALDGSVVYQLFRDQQGEWVKIGEAESFRGELSADQPKSIKHHLTGLTAGRYRVVVNGTYGGSGKEASYIFIIKNDGTFEIEQSLV
ncbi:hypothetical protein [Brevibacillus dissolubilis]|uniref:hypothetical protein n=1 Tax=Brevibacillus dissolubilis TaxID=1844116 RepID=UPI001116ACC1|nr:hypothetical protein [Brevibacillus dissolubilis]